MGWEGSGGRGEWEVSGTRRVSGRRRVAGGEVGARG